MEKIISIVLILISFVSHSQTFKYEKADILISFDTNIVVPSTWKITKTKEIYNQEHYLKLIKASLDKYPAGILKNLKKVYILSTLESNGVSIGGTKYNGCLFIKVKNVVDIQVEKTLHHEFCHMLYFNHEELFPVVEWKNNTKRDYVGKGFKASYNGKDSKTYVPTLFQYGFLYEYASISIDEDMASYAESLFYESDKQTIKNNPLLKNKYLLLVSFYKKIDPNFISIL